MDMLFVRNKLYIASIAWAVAAAAVCCATPAQASPVVSACETSLACAALGQFNFGILGGGDKADAPETPSNQSRPRLLGGRSSGDANAARPDPFQYGDRDETIDRLTASGKAQAKAHLDKARAALAQRDLAGAEGWYHKAASVGATFDRGEYSPAQLKDELIRAGVSPSRLNTTTSAPSFGGNANMASQRTLPTLPEGSQANSVFEQRTFGNSPNQPRGDFIPSRVVQASFNEPAANGQGGNELSRFSQQDPQRDLGARIAAPNQNPQQAASDMLRDARRALAAGNAEKAAELADAANRLGLRYAPQDDTPFKVRGLVEGHNKLMAAGPLNGPHAQSPQFKLAYATLLMDQADGLMGYGEYDAAEAMGRRAFQVKADFTNFDRTPAQLLAQIASRRRNADAEMPLPPRTDVAQAGSGPRRLPTAPAAEHPRHREAVALLAQARAAMARGDLPRAEQFAQQAKSFNIPDQAFASGDDRPWVVLLDIERAKFHTGGVQPASNFEPAGNPSSRFAVQPGVYRPDIDQSRVVQAQSLQPTPDSPPQRLTEGHRLYQRGEQALLDRQVDEAVDLFKQAWKFERQLDPQTRGRLQTYLQDLAANNRPRSEEPTQIDDVEAHQQVAMQQLFSDVSRTLRQVEDMRDRDPKAAIERLKQLRDNVSKSEIRAAIRDQQVARIDRSILSMERFIEDNRAQIEQDDRNREIYGAVEKERTVRIEVQQNLAELADEFNRLLQEHQFAEAEAVARQARELNPEAEIVQTMLWKARFVRSLQTGMAIREQSEENWRMAMMSVDRSGIPMDDSKPYQLPDVRYWQELTERRSRSGSDRNRRLTEADVAIYNALKTKVDVRFDERPLSEVIHTLAAGAGINVHIDRQGLAAEGITSDTPVTINLLQPISLQSALNHILHELRLSYVVQDEVLKVTSEQMRESDVHREVYNVADLVIPIPNFTPSYNMGLAAALRQAHADLGAGWVGGRVNEVPLQVAGGDSSHVNPLTLGQMQPGGTRAQQPIGFGPGGVTGGVQPDFDSLVDLITTTVSPTTWDEVGGPGSVVGLETNLSLVISQTQEVHDEIVDLLEQLRRLQDLQVTIEVRFITLNDNFFERIGVDFDFDIDDNVQALPPDDGGPSVTIGLDPTGQPTADFDISFMQDSFTASVPQFGGFDPATAANFGFAILGEIEAFFLIQAAQGDTRTNVMQAPKVTLFNGQQAFVSDTSQTPFVTSVVPVVGDFAAAHQPVIIVLTEGTSLSVQAVVSPDRRFVRLTIVPFFSKIDDVKTFTFEGKRTSTSSQSSVDPDQDGNGGQNAENEGQVIEGTTVQLPTFSFVTVTTTVSVPDGGTVLLGGVKRLSEGRTERGVPMLNKLPYVNRLFKNVGIGRETQSLMMMVTPRIIIQEEEEEKIGIGGFGGSP